MYTIAVVGSRDYIDYDEFYGCMRGIINGVCTHKGVDLNDIMIISGGARGADSMAEQFAEDDGMPYMEYGAEWDTYGKAAGMRRNSTMVEKADYVVAFWDGESSGTLDSIEKAQLAGKDHKVIFYDAKQREDGAVL